MVKCLLCKKKLKFDKQIKSVVGAGTATIQFWYNSRYDKIGTFPPEEPLAKLLNADEIRFFICDDCFEKNADLFDGYDFTHTVKETKVK